MPLLGAVLLQVPITHISQSFISSSKPCLSEIILYLLDMTWGLFIQILWFWRWRIRGIEIQVHRHALSHTIFRYQNWNYPSMLLLKFPRSVIRIFVFFLMFLTGTFTDFQCLEFEDKQFEVLSIWPFISPTTFDFPLIFRVVVVGRILIPAG